MSYANTNSISNITKLNCEPLCHTGLWIHFHMVVNHEVCGRLLAFSKKLNCPCVSSWLRLKKIPCYVDAYVQTMVCKQSKTDWQSHSLGKLFQMIVFITLFLSTLAVSTEVTTESLKNFTLSRSVFVPVSLQKSSASVPLVLVLYDHLVVAEETNPSWIALAKQCVHTN